MRYEEALSLIHERSRFGNKLTLTRIRELLHLLGDPQEDLAVVHIGGTNGKGSVSKFVYGALLAQGYRVGLYTSPYVSDFRERIECCGEWIGRDELADIADAVFGAVSVMESTGSDAPTEFEVITAMAFLYYKKKNCDFVVVEVGLGGRGDATNVLSSPLASVITSISLDHTDYLGDTLEEIAAEKAGIIKPGRPVICRVADEAARAVIRGKALACGSAFYDAEQETSPARVQESTLEGSLFSLSVLGQLYENMRIKLAGIFQIENAATALCTLEVLRRDCGVELEEQAIRKGLAEAVHAGRMETLCRDPLILIDGAHNADGMEAFCRSIRPLIRGRKTLLTLGILRDKEIERMLQSALELGVDLALSEPDNPRKAAAQDLYAVLRSLGGDAVLPGDARQALTYAMERREIYDCLLFAGSLYFISAIREQHRCEKEKE